VDLEVPVWADKVCRKDVPVPIAVHGFGECGRGDRLPGSDTEASALLHGYARYTHCHGVEHKVGRPERGTKAAVDVQAWGTIAGANGAADLAKNERDISLLEEGNCGSETSLHLGYSL
jgi:hypothetical protein